MRLNRLSIKTRLAVLASVAALVLTGMTPTTASAASHSGQHRSYAFRLTLSQTSTDATITATSPARWQIASTGWATSFLTPVANMSIICTIFTEAIVRRRRRQMRTHYVIAHHLWR